MYHLQKFYTMNSFHQVDHACISKTKVTIVLILLDLQTLVFPAQMFGQSKQLVVLDFQDSF